MPAETLRPLTPKQVELKHRLEELLRANDDNLAEVARTLGKDRAQLYRWMRRLGLRRDSRERSRR
jgi:transcriptional regulator with GAF, ATPase, and Fis domain